MENLPDALLLQVFDYLDYLDIISLGQCCHLLRRICDDEILWRNLFYRQFKLSYRDAPIPLCSSSWKFEFIRCIDAVPIVGTEVVTKHVDEVLHATFSHDGQRLVTTGKDRYIHVWKVGYPMELEYSRNMTSYDWQFTLYSQFNESDTHLLVSGGVSNDDANGQIAIFSFKGGFRLECRVRAEPFDTFGQWYSDKCFLSAVYRHRVVIWRHEIPARECVTTERPYITLTNEKHRFCNPPSRMVRIMLVAPCVEHTTALPLPNEKSMPIDSGGKSPREPDESTTDSAPISSPDKIDARYSCNPQAKWLIFSCGEEACYKLAFKKCPLRDESDNNEGGLKNDTDLATVHKILEFHGIVIGFKMSPDHRYLYVNLRPWAEGCVMDHPRDVPPLELQVDVHIIDMDSLTEVGRIRNAHEAHTTNDGPFFLFLDTNDFLLAGGSEENYCYLWDRHYGMSLAKLPHYAGVNCIAFNPKEPEMLVTVSDDLSFKVWRSRGLCRRMGLALSDFNTGTKTDGMPKIEFESTYLRSRNSEI